MSGTAEEVIFKWGKNTELASQRTKRDKVMGTLMKTRARTVGPCVSHPLPFAHFGLFILHYCIADS